MAVVLRIVRNFKFARKIGHRISHEFKALSFALFDNVEQLTGKHDQT